MNEEERKALIWAIEMLKPQNDSHAETICGRNAAILRGLLEKLMERQTQE